MVVDYSKWDRLSDSEDEAPRPRGQPRVTRLERPSSVRLGGGEVEVTVPAPPAAAAGAAVAAAAGTAAGATAGAAAAPAPLPSAGAGRKTSQVSPAAKTILARVRVAQAADAPPLFWSQTKDSVEIYLPVATEIRGRAVAVEVLQAGGGNDDGPAMPEQNGGASRLRISIENYSKIDKILRFCVKVDEDAVFWQIEDGVGLPDADALAERQRRWRRMGDGDEAEAEAEAEAPQRRTSGSSAPDPGFKASRCLHITLAKFLPQGLPSAVLWWDRLLRDEPHPAVDTRRLRGPPRDAGKSSFADVWGEAHKIFKEKIAAQVGAVDVGAPLSERPSNAVDE